MTGASDVCGIDAAIVAGGCRREKRQTEELLAHGISKFLRRRNRTETVTGNENFNIGKHLQDNGDTDCHLELIISNEAAGHADRTSHGLQGVRHNGFIRNGEQHIAVNADDTLTNVFDTAAVCKQDVNGNIHSTTHASKTRPVAKAFNR